MFASSGFSFFHLHLFSSPPIAKKGYNKKGKLDMKEMHVHMCQCSCNGNGVEERKSGMIFICSQEGVVRI